MKRNSLTAIVGTVQLLTMDAIIYFQQDRRLEYYSMIRKAAVNEIIRLDGEAPQPTENGNSHGGVTPNQEQICCNLTKPKP